MISPDSKVIIVGAGVFGLSTSLWLARGGYKNITVFDQRAFDKNFYDPSNGVMVLPPISIRSFGWHMVKR